MKIRKELTKAKNDLLKETMSIMDDHNCPDYTDEGMTCVICCLHTLRKPLALVQFLRTKGLLNRVLEAELKLFDLLGEKRLKQKTKEEVEIIRNTPKKKCFNCGRIVILWMPYSSAALYAHSFSDKKLQTTCSSCGELVHFSSDELKYKKRKGNKDSLVYAIGLVGRFGYSHHDGNDEYYEEDENEDDDPDN